MKSITNALTIRLSFRASTIRTSSGSAISVAFAFEQFCREYPPVEMWEWKNEEAIRRCNPESFSGHDFEVFGYEVDVKSSRDVSAFLPESLVERDPDDDIVVMVWHRDNEDSLMLLGWERLETLKSKVESEAEYSGEAPAKLDHLAARPMNEADRSRSEYRSHESEAREPVQSG